MTTRSTAACAAASLLALVLLALTPAFAQKPYPTIATSLSGDSKFDGKIFVLESVGAGGKQDKKQYINGLTGTGTTDLSPTFHAPKGDVSGTRWKFSKLKDGNYGIKCLGDGKGVTWLDGWTTSGDVKLASETGHNFTGTHWKIHDANGKYQIECRGAIEGPRFLDVASGGKLKLAKATADAGTYWNLIPSKAGSL